ncbi:MAG: Na(+)/H(+) antiporter subunit B [Gammaproteobacteria bacterium]
MRRNPVLKEVSNLLTAPILLFALYVQFHGDYGPGGGFQAGVIFGAGIILYSIIYGLDKAQSVFPPARVRIAVALGLLLYASVGFAGVLLGGNYLDYNVLAHDPVEGQHIGILLIELGVGITVAAVMITIFYAFAGRAQPNEGSDR